MTNTRLAARHWISRRFRLNGRELSGAFGDLGTDLPLLTGMALASGLDAGWLFLVFGVMQVAAALIYGIPMPVQPLKAVAALVIVGGLGGPVIAGGALSIALIMLALTLSGAIDGMARIIPKAAIRGMQLGLGLKLSLLAVGTYMPAHGRGGGLLAAGCLVVLLAMLRNRRFPATVVVLLIGALYAVVQGADLGRLEGFALPAAAMGAPSARDLWLGCVLLALPQIPLSLGNSVLATEQLARDWFPEARVTARKIGVTYSLFNVAAALLGGAPVCHGSGGMAGHYAFGARTGASTAIYGLFYMALALATCVGYHNITLLFPLPVLGAILLVEGAALIGRMGDMPVGQFDWNLALVVGIIACWAPYGFLTGLIVGAAAPLVWSRARATGRNKSVEVSS